MRCPVFNALAASFALTAALVSSPVLAQAQPKVGLMMKSLANEFFKDMTEGALAHQMAPAAMKKAGLNLAFIGPDNRAAARMAGDALVKAIRPGAKVVIIEGNPGTDNAQQRKAGFMDSVKKGKPLQGWVKTPIALVTRAKPEVTAPCCTPTTSAHRWSLF